MPPLVITLPNRRAVSRRPLSRRPPALRRAASPSSLVTPSSSSCVITSDMSQGGADVLLSFNRNITINHSTGSEQLSEDEDSFGRVSSHSASQDEDYSSSGEEEEGWDYIDDEIEPSDSASRPRLSSKHRAVPPPAPRPASLRRKSAHRAPVREPPVRHRSSSGHGRAKEPRQRRSRPESVHSDELDSHDDYPGYPPRGAPPPNHPSQQWSHVPPASGYAPSTISTHPSHPHGFGGFPGGLPPPGQLVPFSGADPYAFPPVPNPFSTGGPGPNPFAAGPPPPPPGGFFGPEGHRPGRGHRNSMGPPPGPPGSEMMPFFPGGGGYYPYGSPYGMPPGMPPGMSPMYPYGPPPIQTPPPHSKKSTPGAEHAAPPPAQQPTPAPAPAVPAAPPAPAKEDLTLARLEKLLLHKDEVEAKAAEDQRFSKLEQLLLEQQQARIKKEQEKKAAAEETARKAAEAKKKGDEDKLAKLEKLILAQKDEQLKREAALEAARAAEKAEAESKAAKEAAEKKAAAEAAAKLLEAAKQAREEAEAKAAKEAEEAKAAHEKALAEAKAAAEELEKAKKAAEEEAAKLKPKPEEAKAPIKFKDAVGRKFSFPWHLCKTWKVRCQLIAIFVRPC